MYYCELDVVVFGSCNSIRRENDVESSTETSNQVRSLEACSSEYYDKIGLDRSSNNLVIYNKDKICEVKIDFNNKNSDRFKFCYDKVNIVYNSGVKIEVKLDEELSVYRFSEYTIQSWGDGCATKPTAGKNYTYSYIYFYFYFLCFSFREIKKLCESAVNKFKSYIRPTFGYSNFEERDESEINKLMKIGLDLNVPDIKNFICEKYEDDYEEEYGIVAIIGNYYYRYGDGEVCKDEVNNIEDYGILLYLIS